MAPRRLNKVNRPRPSLPPVGPLFRNLGFALICFWATNSGASGGFRRGTLLVAQWNKIFLMEPIPSSTPRSYGTAKLFPSAGQKKAVAVDNHNGFVYYNDQGTHQMKRAKLDGSEVTTVLSDEKIIRIAVDPAEDKVYFINNYDHNIYTVSSDGTGKHTLLTSNGSVQGVALELNHRLLFYTKSGPAGIRKANMNGSGEEVIVPPFTGRPKGIAIDYDNCRICWADEMNYHIKCRNYTGGDERVVLTKVKPHGLAIQDGVAYHTCTSSSARVYSVRLDDGSTTSIDTGEFVGGNYGIAIVQGKYQPINCSPIPGIVPITAIAKGFRDFGDCAVFTDRKRNTCAKVTSSTNPYDFRLRADVSQCQNEARVRVVLKDGDCSDKTQVHVDTMEKSVGRGPFNGYFLRCELTKTEKFDGDVSLCSFCCQCPAQGCDFVFVRVFGRNGPVRSLCEVELMDP